MYYIECSDCGKEAEKDEIYHCENCNKGLCFHCYITGNGLCEECFEEES